MRKMRNDQQIGRWVNAASFVLAVALSHGAIAVPAQCPREGTLGTSRVLAVDPVNPEPSVIAERE